MDGEEATKYFYRIERRHENVLQFPSDIDIDPPGFLGWLYRYYREEGLNVNTLRNDISDAFSHAYGINGYEGMLDLYKAVLSKRKFNRETGAANDDEPDRHADINRLFQALEPSCEREGWFAEWKPPQFGPARTSPFSAILSKYARVHTRAYHDNMVALLKTGNPSPYI